MNLEKFLKNDICFLTNKVEKKKKNLCQNSAADPTSCHRIRVE